MRALLLLLVCLQGFASPKPVLRVGSKSFTESYVLSEILAQVIEDAGEATVERKFGLGQTGIAFEAIRNEAIDLYTEYTGTLSEAILKEPGITTTADVRRALEPLGLTISESLGFNNTYALAVTPSFSVRRGVSKISDLTKVGAPRAGFSHEFLKRADCYPRIKATYAIPFSGLQGFSHALSYEALVHGEVDVIDVYSTDAKVTELKLRLLDDDKGVFPIYLAVILARSDVTARFPKTWAALRKLEGTLDTAAMSRLNGMAEREKKSFSEIAAEALGKKGASSRIRMDLALIDLTLQHLFLVFASLLASLVIGIPLAILAARFRTTGQLILAASGVIQTIPSLALLCFLIPWFGIGTKPSLIALFLYGLLPILRCTYVGLVNLDPGLAEIARAMGLTPAQRLLWIRLPLASPQILSGIQTSATINVGTATLAAFVGAGGYGVPIVTGLALNDTSVILMGAIPAALMAIAVHGAFAFLERVIIPRGLQN